MGFLASQRPWYKGRGDHMDGLIGKLIYACQMNDVRKAFSVYDKLKRLKVGYVSKI